MNDRKPPTSTVDNLKVSKEQREQLKAIGAEKIEEYAKALNAVASTPHGEFFLQSLIKSLKVFEPINIKGNVDDIVQRNVYLQKIRPFLSDEIRRELEK